MSTNNVSEIRLLNDTVVDKVFKDAGWDVRLDNEGYEAIMNNISVIWDTDFLYLCQDGTTSYFEQNFVLEEIRDIKATQRHVTISMYNGNMFVFTTGCCVVKS